jgi:hypothetical protein
LSSAYQAKNGKELKTLLFVKNLPKNENSTFCTSDEKIA